MLQFGTPKIHRCPKCKKLVLEKTLKETSPDGAVCYSDSRVEAPNHPLLPSFSRCPYCGRYCWLEDLETLAIGDEITAEEFANALSYEMMPLDNIAEFIRLGYADTKFREYKARVALYQNYNDRIRRMLGASEAELKAALWRDEADKAQWSENIDALYALAEELTPEEIPFFAELRRQQGRFDEALAILDKGCEPHYQKACDSVRILCELKNPFVFIV